MRKTNKSMLLILVLLIAVVLSLSAVSAEDVAADGDIISVDDSISDVSLDDASIGETANEIGSVEASSEDSGDTASVNTDTNTLGDGDSTSWYVDSNVETTGDGSQASPFKTIGEAVNASTEGSTIYLASGIYNTADDMGLTINNSLSIIGESRENTVIDMSYQKNFVTINSKASVYLSNLQFINSRTGQGAVYLSDGDLTVENCDFDNCIANYYGGALYLYGNSVIRNCTFTNNKGSSSAGAIYVYGYSRAFNVSIEDCTFDNNTMTSSYGKGGSVYISGNSANPINVTIKNSTFTRSHKTVHVFTGASLLVENCTFLNNTYPSTYLDRDRYGGIIYSQNSCPVTIDSCVFENNTQAEGQLIYTQSDLTVSNSKFLNNIPNMVNSTIWGSGKIYLENNTCDCVFLSLPSSGGSLKFGLNVTVLDNTTIDIDSLSINLYATLTDNDGNLLSFNGVYQNYVRLFLDEELVNDSLQFIGGQSSYSFKKALNGTHLVRFLLPNSFTNVTYKTGMINVHPNMDPVDIYVATDGSDETGDGTEANPYKTVEKGLDVAYAAYTATIHIKGGTYNYSSKRNIDTAGGVLNIIGYGGDVVIDMGNKNIFAIISNTSNVLIENIDFVNGSFNNNYTLDAIITSNGNLTIKHCDFINNTANYATVSGANIVDSCNFYNNYCIGGANDLTRCGGYIVNSTFYANESSTKMSVTAGLKDLTIENCKFYNSYVTLQSGSASLAINSCEFYNPNIQSIYVSVNNLTVNNCTFSGSNAMIQLSGSNTCASVINSKFINNTGKTSQSSIYDNNIKELYLENNTVIDNAAPYVYAQLTSTTAFITSPTTIVVLNNETIEQEGFGAVLKAKIFDDNGNSIALSRLTFDFNDETVSGTLSNDEMVAKLIGLYNGTYLVSAISSNLKDCEVKTGVLVITPLINKDLYVSTTGSDETGDGTEANPFATLNKAMEEAIAYNNTIHVAEGVYDVDTALAIDTNTAIISIVGNGENTVFDMGNAVSFISSISTNSIIELHDLSLVNAINRVIDSQGILTLDKVNLINSTGSTGGAIRNRGNLTVVDSYFENIVATSNGGAIWSNNYVCVLNTIFNQTTTSRSGGAIYSSNYLYLKNNTFIDTSAGTGNFVWASNTIDGGLILTVMDNETWDITTSSFTLNASLTDENNNPIYVSNIPLTFYLDGVQIVSSTMTGEIFATTANLKLNGVYTASATLGNLTDITIKTATLNFANPDALHDVYISVDGDDSTGDGTSENPYASFSKALSVVESMNGVIHVMSNFTEGLGTINNLKNLTIIGEGDDICKTGNLILGTINNGSSLNLVNLKFTGFPDVFNSFLTSQAGSKLSLINCTFENNKAQGGNQASFIHSLGDELNIINCKIINNDLKPYSMYMDSQFIYSRGKTNIINSTFANNRYTSVSSLLRTLLSVNNATIENCVFEDNLGLLMSASNTIINNCTFERNDDGNYGLIRGSVIINNSQFKDMNCTNLISATAASSIINNTFEDINGSNIINATGSAVVTIFNNTLSNIGDTKYVYLASSTSQVNGSSYTLTFNDNATYEIVGNSLALNASLVDADGNYITGPGAIIYFTLNGEDIGSQACMDIANYNAKFSGEGEYILSGYTNSVYDPESLTIKTATLKITQIPEKIIYVDILGNDETGDGSEDNPYASLSRAMQDAVALNNIIYIQPGVYDNMVIGDQFVFIENQTLSIIGLSNEVDKVIIENISSTFLNAMGRDTSKTYGSLIVKNIEFVNATPGNLFFRLSYLNTIELDNVSLIDSSISGNYFIADYYSDGKLILDGLKVSNVTASNLVYSSSNAAIEIVDSIFENNALNRFVSAYSSVNCSISNSVFVSNTWSSMVYSNGVVELENNWWGNNTNADELRTYTGREITNWIVADVTANDSDIGIGDTVKFDLILKLNDGSELTGVLPTRIVKAIADNTAFDPESVEVVNNAATITGTVSGTGDITISIDNQDFVFDVKGYNAYITVDNVAIKLGETATVTVTFTDDNGPLANKELAVNVNGEESTVTTDADGKATITLADLAKGNHIVEVNFAGDNMHDPVTGAGLVMVSDAVLTVNIPEVNYGESPTINVELKDSEGNPLSGLVTVNINGKDYNVLVKDGEGSLAVPDKFDAGEYTISAKLIGDSITESTATFVVDKLSSAMTVTVADVAYGEPFVINLDIADKTVSGLSIVTINGVDYAVEIANGAASKAINAILPGGSYDVTAKFIGDNYDIADATDSFVVSELIGANVVITVNDIKYGESETVKVTVTDLDGNPVSGLLKLIVDTEEQNITVTGGEAEIVLDNLLAGNHSVVANYIGDEQYASSYGFASFKVEKIATQVVLTNMATFAYQSAIDGDIGDYFVATLTDINGNPLANKTVKVGLNGRVYTRTTNATGGISVLMKTAISGRYTFAVSFLGDDNYDACFAVALCTVNKQTPKLTTSGKTYKASAKTKTLTATFKTKAGKALKGKTIKFTVNGKTYTAKTNAKGVATVKVSISKKGTYNFTAKYAGDSTYAAISKKAKLVIK